MNRLTCGLLLAMMPLLAQAATPEEWQTWQADTPAFQSRVEQSRWLPEAETRVHADGELLYTPTQSLAWQWVTPQPRIVALDMTGQFVELTPDVPELSVVPLSETDDGLPEERQVIRLLFQLMQGNLSALRERYHLLLDGEREDWQLILLPRDRSEGALKKVAVEGGRFIESLQFVSAQDNELSLTLSDPQPPVEARGAQLLAESLTTDTIDSTDTTMQGDDSPDHSASAGPAASDD